MRRGAVRAIVLAVLAVWVPRSVQGAGAAPAAKPSASVKIVPRLNAYFATGFNDAAWQKGALDKVLKNWKPKGLPKPGAKTVLISTIGKEGTVTGARDHLLTGDAEWDKACGEALKAASPFPPLPKSWPYPSLEVHWHFEAGK